MLHISNFINNKINSNNLEESISSIRSILFKNYIKTVIEDCPKENGFRMMFIGNRFKSDFTNPITAECNGAIYEFNTTDFTFKPLVIPTNLFNSQKLVKNNIATLYKEGKYNVFPVMDGTILNLYYYKNRWRISTNKAYDATDLLFCDGKTYGNILEELMSYSHNNLKMEELDTSHCYTILIKYSKFHFFNSHKDTNKIVIMRSVNLSTAQITWNTDIGISNSKECVAWKPLNNNIQTSINKFKKECNNINYKPFLGVILRAVDSSVPIEYRDILIESNLMSTIRNFIYNFTFTKTLKYHDSLDFNNTGQCIADSNYYNLMEINKLHIFLQRKNSTFLSLFPQFKHEFNNYNLFIIFLTKLIMRNYTSLYKQIEGIDIKNTEHITLFPVDEHNEFEYNIKLKNLTIIMVSFIKDKKINIMSPEGWDILYDFLINIKYVDYYYSYLFKS